MRARNIKPAFFLNEDLAEVDAFTRLLFIGLWCFADRNGRFEWKPKKIKAAIFPYDNIKIEGMLSKLTMLKFITCHNNIGYVLCFTKHQNPHPHEAKSILPPLPENIEQNQCHDMTLNVAKCNADSLIPDSLIPDSKPLSEYSDDFLSFWKEYPNKTGKGKAYERWCKRSPPIDRVLQSLSWQKLSRKWIGGFVPNPETYLNQKRWEDEPEEAASLPQKQRIQTIAEIRRANNDLAVKTALAKYGGTDAQPGTMLHDPQATGRGLQPGAERPAVRNELQDADQSDRRGIDVVGGTAGQVIEIFPQTGGIFGNGPDHAKEKRRAESLAAAGDP